MLQPDTDFSILANFCCNHKSLIRLFPLKLWFKHEAHTWIYRLVVTLKRKISKENALIGSKKTSIFETLKSKSINRNQVHLGFSQTHEISNINFRTIRSDNKTFQ